MPPGRRPEEQRERENQGFKVLDERTRGDHREGGFRGGRGLFICLSAHL
jgi:hypothetical protein